MLPQKCGSATQLLSGMNIRSLKEMIYEVSKGQRPKNELVDTVTSYYDRFGELLRMVDENCPTTQILEAKIQDAHNQIEELRRTVETKDEALNACYSQINEYRITTLNNSILINSKDTLIANLNSSLSQANDMKAAIEHEANERIHEYNSQLRELGHQCKTEKDELMQQLTSAEEINEKKDRKIQELQNEIQALNEQMVKMEKEHNQRESTEHQQCLQMETKYIEKLSNNRCTHNQQEEELLEWKQAAEKSKSELEVVSQLMKTKDSNYMDRINELKEQLKAAENRENKYRKASQELSQMLGNESRSTHVQIQHNYEDQIMVLEVQVNELKEQLRKESSLIEELKENREQYAERIAELENYKREETGTLDREEYLSIIQNQKDTIKNLERIIREPRAESAADVRVSELAYEELKNDQIRRQKQQQQAVNLLNQFSSPERRPKSSFASTIREFKANGW